MRRDPIDWLVVVVVIVFLSVDGFIAGCAVAVFPIRLCQYLRLIADFRSPAPEFLLFGGVLGAVLVGNCVRLSFRCPPISRLEPELSSASGGIVLRRKRCQFTLHEWAVVVAGLAVVDLFVAWVVRMPKAARVEALQTMLTVLNLLAIWWWTRWQTYQGFALAELRAKRWERALIDGIHSQGKNQSPKYQRVLHEFSGRVERLTRRRKRYEVWWCPCFVTGLWRLARTR
jgi:hypothetical protein